MAGLFKNYTIYDSARSNVKAFATYFWSVSILFVVECDGEGYRESSQFDFSYRGLPGVPTEAVREFLKERYDTEYVFSDEDKEIGEWLK